MPSHHHLCKGFHHVLVCVGLCPCPTPPRPYPRLCLLTFLFGTKANDGSTIGRLCWWVCDLAWIRPRLFQFPTWYFASIVCVWGSV